MIRQIRERHEAWNRYKAGLRKSHYAKFAVVESLETIFVALAMALVIRKFIFQTSLVFSGSMIPTMEINDRLIVNKVIYRLVEPSRGDIILFQSPYKDDKEFVKRLVGLPGETIEVKQGIIYINGEQLILAGVNVRRDYSYFGPRTIPEGHYFVMGDNRANSADSRVWGFVSHDDLIGKATFTFWPINRAQLLH
ncbi:MAG: signal peptidase I [bacterium]|nr:signal peptidase I [bacterium]